MPSTRTEGSSGDGGAIEERPARPVSAISLSVESLSRVGEPFTVRVRAQSLVGERDLRLFLYSPDLQLATRPSQEIGGQRLGILPTTMNVGRVARGGERSLSNSFVVVEPGLYRFSGVAFAPPSPDVRGRDPEEQVLGVAEMWVLIDSLGGRVHSTFEEVEFPTGVQAAPGPFRPHPSTLANGASMISPSVEMCAAYSGVVLYLNYDAPDTLQTPPVAHAAIIGHRYPLYGGGAPDFFSTVTDAQGLFSVTGLEDHYFEGYIVLDGTTAQVGAGGIAHATPISVSAQCGGSGFHILTSNRAGRVWSTLLPTVTRAVTEFQRVRPKIRVDIVNPPTSTANGTFYYRSDDRITIDTNSVWGQRGRFVVAHEYGHAFHHKALGGIDTFGSCGPGGIHFLSGAYSLGCAMREGIANFFAAFVLQDSILGRYEDIFENAHLGPFLDEIDLPLGYWCPNKSLPGPCSTPSYTKDGALNETAVAGLLYDLADNETTNNGAIGVDDDPAQALGAKWVGDVIASCEVMEGGVWVRANGIDHLIYCFERTLGGYQAGGYFPSRSALTQDWGSSAVTPSGWSAKQVRTIWQNNLYVHGPYLPSSPPPSFSASISGFGQVEPGATCTSTATTNVPNPTTFTWTIDGVPVGQNSMSVTHSAGETFVLAVTVTNAALEGASESRQIAVYHGAGQCLDM